MIKNIGTLLLFFTVFIFACQDSNSNSSKGNPASGGAEGKEQLFKEVMAIHDEMMPKIKPIRDAQKELLSILKDSTQNLTAEQTAAYSKAYTGLENADKIMHDWMKQFKAPTDDMTNEAAIIYLRKQKKEVSIMKTKMLQNMAMAKDFVDL